MAIHRPATLCVALASSLLLHQVPCAAQDRQAHGIITYGLNTPEWNDWLHLTGVREACKEIPAICVKRVGDHARQQGVGTMFLNVLLEAPAVESDAAEYARLSRTHPALFEVGIDDFASHYYHLFKDRTAGDPAGLLSTVIGSLKADKSALRFGLTLYEDELESPFLQDAKLPAAIRGQVDYVHLYLHYRTNGPAFATFVEEARRLFPHAQIIAGAYAFDRIDYMPCTKGGARCSRDEELSLFQQAIQIQASLLQKGTVAAIEFYPANFGLEEAWNGWNVLKNCDPVRRGECVANTRLMRETALKVLRAHGLGG